MGSRRYCKGIRRYYYHTHTHTKHGANQKDGAQTRAAKAFAILSILFALLLVPIERIAAREAALVSHKPAARERENRGESDRDAQNPRPLDGGISAREQLRRRGSF